MQRHQGARENWAALHCILGADGDDSVVKASLRRKVENAFGLIFRDVHTPLGHSPNDVGVECSRLKAGALCHKRALALAARDQVLGRQLVDGLAHRALAHAKACGQLDLARNGLAGLPLAMLQAVQALRNRDVPAANRIYRDDSYINDKRYAIENAILILIATQQPMARDLRLLAAMLEVINELERMGDYAKGVAKIARKIDGEDLPIPAEFDRMAQLAVEMLHRALSAFVRESAAEASSIPREDDQVDALYNQVYRQIVNWMIANPNTIDHANLLMWVAHNLERMADRVTNICERTVFIVTGELMEMDTTDDEDADFDDED